MPGNWVFRSLRLKGRQPRVANMLVEDYPLPAAAKAGILSSHRNDENRLVDDEPRRFGFHNLRRSLASFLVRGQTDPKTVPNGRLPGSKREISRSPDTSFPTTFCS